MGYPANGDEEMSAERETANKSIKDLKPIMEEDLSDLNQGRFNKFLDKTDKLFYYFNFFLKFLSLEKNFNASILELQFSAGETKTISHLLGVRPKYRIILRQEGNGVLSDIPSSWNDKSAVIINNGAVIVNATIMFLKE